MKILIVDNSAVSRVGGHFFTNNLNGDFINELLSFNNTISYFQFYADKNDNISVYDLIKNGVRCVTIKIRKNKILRYLLAYLQIIPEIIKADFIYFYYPNTFRFASFFCKFLHKPFGVYVRGMNGVKDNISEKIYRNAYTVFTVSDYFTNMVNDITHSKKAHTIRPMIPYSNDDVVNGRIYLPRKEYRILFLGRVAKDKGLGELVQAIEILHNEGFLIKVQIVGNGEFLKQLQDIVSEKKLNNIISIEGPVYDNDVKAAYYKKSDIYVLPTYHEGFPRTLYEAMIFGTPIVTTFVGGISALMIDKENCVKIEPQSVESIVDGLRYAMNNYKEMGMMANKGTVLVKKIVDKNRLSHAQHLNQIISNYGK